jgi:two-component system, NtrC family, sensor kinase
VAKAQRQKYISLRLILLLWFFVLSIVPLALVSFYSVIKFEKALEGEQIQRLQSNAREIEVIMVDYQNELKNNRDTISMNPHVTFNLTVADDAALKEYLGTWLDSSGVSHISIYNRDGKKMTYAEKEYYTSAKMPAGEDKLSLDSYVMDLVETGEDYGYINGVDTGLELGMVSKIINSAKKTIGFVEQKILLKQNFLNRIKSDLKLEMILVDEKYKIVNSTLERFSLISSETIANLEMADGESLVDVPVDNNTYSFIVYTVMWGKSPLKIIIGTNKKDSQAALKNINVAFLGVTGLGIALLLLTILISTSFLLKPVKELIRGLKDFENTDTLVQLKVKNRTEIGLLISTFNQMSLNVHQTRIDLRKKIKELEKSNLDLKEAQTQLVQSAKMTSLGQLVAGVAHELNNPIGFIYSNTSHLREYSEKLFEIINEIEKNPERAEQIKAENDFNFIQQDLPKLIKSCQDGAQRTRDIVRGLRNFSRLEESQLKEIDLHESIDMTLELLKGETKNRIQIHKQYETIPHVYCYASQINQVIMNILTNAVHAISGNGQIWISTQTLKASATHAGRVQMIIQDNGIGMEPEVVEKIFEPFFTTKDVGQGTGLGLSISYGIVQNHGGNIQVKSSKGVGTEFVITIPVTQTAKV